MKTRILAKVISLGCLLLPIAGINRAQPRPAAEVAGTALQSQEAAGFDGVYTTRVYIDPAVRPVLVAGPLVISPVYVEGVNSAIQLVIEQAIHDWEATIQYSGTTPNPYTISF